MSSALLRNGVSPERAISLSEPVSRLLHEMLHAMGQPLTVLQTCRLLARSPAARSSSDVILFADMADQVDAVTEMYEALRLILEVQAEGTEGTAVRLDEAMREIEPRWQRQALRRGVRLGVVIGQVGELVGKRACLERALDVLFESLLASVGDGGSVQVTAETVEDAACITLLGGDQTEQARTPTWKLRAAGALLGECGGRAAYAWPPFRVQVELGLHARPSLASPAEGRQSGQSCDARRFASTLPV